MSVAFRSPANLETLPSEYSDTYATKLTTVVTETERNTDFALQSTKR
jgi:hypothetical protein